MQRIMVIGSPGSGKSTFARQLSAITNIDAVHLDALFWKPGWVETPKPEWEHVMRELVHHDRWIIDGNYGGTIDIRLDAADTIIFLDMPRLLCLWRVVKRRIQYAGRTRADMGPDCEEKLSWRFLSFIWNYPNTSRPAILQKLRQYSRDKRIIILQTPASVKRFLDALQSDAVQQATGNQDILGS